MKYGLSFLGSFLVCGLIWVGVVFGQSAGLSKTSQWVSDVYAKKTLRAESIKGRKIVIVSGSNALFGCNSKMLEDAFGMGVVNYGVNAGVFLPYVLYKAKRVIKRGDVVLLPLEYDMYNYDGVPNAQMIDSIYGRERGVFWTLSLREQFLLVWNVTFRRVLDGYKSEGGKAVRHGLYGAHNVDKYGDQVGNTLAKRSKAMEAELDGLEARKFGAEFSRGALAWEYLDEFVSWCRERGVKTVFMPSTLLWFESYKSDERERWFFENLADEVRGRGWEFVGEPYEYMYGKDYYFNTDFHLSDEGRDVRTRQMILDLRGSGGF